MDCIRCKTPVREQLGARGVLIDICVECGGVWLDKGEILSFSASPDVLQGHLDMGLLDAHPSGIDCPRCGTGLTEGGLIKPKLLVDLCPSCGGLWMDGGEMAALRKAEASLRGIRTDPVVEQASRPGGEPSDEREPLGQTALSASARAAALLQPLPNLFVRSAGVMISLYAMLAVVFLLLSQADYISPGSATTWALIAIAIQFVISPYLLDLTLRWTQGLRWVDASELPGPCREFLDELCRRQGLRSPSLGMIDDGTPNAFTYGHFPGNARLVLTRGILDQLGPDEVNAVVAHEVGHIVHWDMLVMTLASVVPIILYYVSDLCLKSGRGKSSSDSKGSGGYVVMVGAVAYLLYWVSQLTLLFLSRTREYHADRFSAEATQNPNALASALFKIALGMAGREPKKDEKGKVQEQPRAAAVTALGVFDPGVARQLALSAGSRTGPIQQEGVAEAMQWDLWNPWAAFYELFSTHPLPAHRIDQLGRLAFRFRQKPFVTFNLQQPESYWDEFAVDVFFHLLPWLAGAAGLTAGALFASRGESVWGLAMVGLGLGGLGRLWYSYPDGPFTPTSISRLLKLIKVSQVRSVPATVEGTIIGKGIPGLVWSEDLVVQDRTGFLFLDYRQPLALFEFWFGITSAADAPGSKAMATGWYRRAPVPYLELSSLTITRPSGQQDTHYCHVLRWKKVGASLLVLAGLFLVFGA